MANERMIVDEYQDIIDVRDIIEEYEDIEESSDSDDRPRQVELEQLLEELRGSGEDERWRGDYYPLTLIRDSYFTQYAQELAEEIGLIDPDVVWPNNCIDWERAARELQYDYTSVEFNGVTYWCR